MKASRLAFAFWTVLSAAAGQTPRITVRVYNYAGVSETALQKAVLEAQNVLRGAEVETRWADCPLRDGQIEPRHLGCLGLTDRADVILRIVPSSMAGVRNVGKSLGFAMPFTGERIPTRAYVLYDHVRQKLANCERLSESRLLGYVMAHEVAHLLFGDEKHSRRGLMMSSWPERELVEMERGTLVFSPDERRVLHASAVARVQAAGQR
jgi:hypothetical protein